MHTATLIEGPSRYQPAAEPTRFTRWLRSLNARLEARERPAAGLEARTLYECGYTPTQAAQALA